MDIALRSYARARSQHRRLPKKASTVPEREARRPGDHRSHFHGPAPIPEGRADLAVTNCTLPGTEGRFTVTMRGGVIQAVLPVGGEVAASEVRDAEGGLVLPGFTDSHVHLLVGAERLRGCDVEDVRDADELSRRIRRFAADNPAEPMLRVYGLNYLDPPLLDPARTREQLDELVPDRPVLVLAHDLHTLWVNTRALEEAGMLRAMPPFPREVEDLGAEDGIERDASGVPTGELREPECYFLVEGALHQRYPRNPEQRLESLRQAAAELNRFGITSVHNMGLAMPEEDVEILLLLLELEWRGELTLRVESSYSVVPDEAMLEDVHDAAELRDRLRQYREGTVGAVEMQRFLVDRLAALDEARKKETEYVSSHDHVSSLHVRPYVEDLDRILEAASNRTAEPREMVTMDAVKLFMDGVVEKDTAYRTDRPPREGIPTFTAEELGETVRLADRLGLQVRAHCIGDGSVGMMLDAIAAAREANAELDGRRGHRVRHRVEHIEVCRPEDIPRFAAVDAVPSMQPFHERAPATMWHTLVPENRWGTAFPWKSLAEQGTPPIFGSDWPIVSCHCLEAARHAAARKPWRPGLPEQGLSMDEALACFTSEPPRAVHREDRLGVLEPGMLADLVVLPAGRGPSEEGVTVAMTVCAGKVVYEGAP